MYKRRLKRVVPLLLAIMMLFSLNTAVLAAEMPDLNKIGSITVNMKDPQTEKSVTGGSLTLYQVGEVIVDNGFKFAFTDEFAASGLSLEDIQSRELAERLNEFVLGHELQGDKKSIDENGTVVFSELDPGLYLLAQRESASGYFPVKPFLVTVPMQSEDESTWIYDVDASPKVELEKEPTPTPTPTPTPGPSLPQTGQLNWPIPVLVLAGVAFFVIGWSLRYRERKCKNAE